MTPEAQNIAIHKAVGLCIFKGTGVLETRAGDTAFFCAKCGLPFGAHEENDYLNDLNAMQSAVLAQSQEFQRRFSTQLSYRASREGKLFCQLTAADWAEDFLTVQREMAETKRDENSQ